MTAAHHISALALLWTLLAGCASSSTHTKLTKHLTLDGEVLSSVVEQFVLTDAASVHRSIFVKTFTQHEVARPVLCGQIFNEPPKSHRVYKWIDCYNGVAKNAPGGFISLEIGRRTSDELSDLPITRETWCRCMSYES